MTEKITQPANYYYNAYFSKKNITHLIHKKRIDRVSALIPPKSKVLDVGCGSGVLGLLLLKKGCDVTGLDLRQECVDFASTVAPEGEFIQGDLLDFDLKRQFDFVICMEVIEHFNEESRHKVISNLDKHVKTGGSLIFAFPSRNYQSIEGLWKLLRKLIYHKIVGDWVFFALVFAWERNK